MDDADTFFRQSPYNIIRLLLMCCGLWPFHTTTRRYVTYCVLMLVIGTGITFEVLGISEIWSEFLEMDSGMPQVACVIIVMFKLFYAIPLLPQIKLLLTKMHEYWYFPKSDEETRILRSSALYGRNLGYIYTGFGISNECCYTLLTLLSKYIPTQSIANETSSKILDEHEGLPYYANYMIDQEKYYIPIFIHCAVCNMIYAILALTFDVLYLTLVQHCCGLFEAVRYRLENTFEYTYGNDDSSGLISTKDELFSNIVYSIRKHTEAIQFADIVESFHRVLLFLHMVVFNISILSVLEYQMSKQVEGMKIRIKDLNFFTFILFNTFFENWQGQKIINSSEKIYESAYNAKWYKMSTKERKLFMMIMMRSKEPSKLTAGKFVVLSYATFSAVLRASWSFVTVLRSTQ